MLTAFILASVIVNPNIEIDRLLKRIDRDRDRKVTVIDHPKGSEPHFDLKDLSGKVYPVAGIWPLTNLLQELKLAQEKKQEEIFPDLIFENPVTRTSRSIRERYWDALTRRIDKDHLYQVLGDSKVKGQGERYLYVPYNDLIALEYYRKVSSDSPGLRLKVVRLPENITGEYVRDLGNKHGLLSLALTRNKSGDLEGVPYVVPGGRFNEMYGWDSYFEALGLIQDGRVDLAKAMVDNFVYEIAYYGKILNANRTYYLTRSQPPFLTSMIRAVLDRLPKSEETMTWLKSAMRAAIKEYQTVWMGEDRLTKVGLSRYFGGAPGIPPEVEPGHFNYVLKPYAKKHGLSVRDFEERYNQGKIKEPELDIFFLHDRAVRESGHDTTYRWRVNGKDRCADFVTVDLNSLLYKFELDLAWLIEEKFAGTFDGIKGAHFREAAAKRKKLIMQYLWDPGKKMFFDYNVAAGKRSDYVSATTLYPLWSMEPSMPESRILNDLYAKDLIDNALKRLEAPGGMAATSEVSLNQYGDHKHSRQWEWPNGWAPHQMLIWQGLINYGQRKIADRLIYRWLYMITKNAMDFNGTVPEKYDVEKKSHAVFAEYGNVGTHFSYITREGFGWMNASYQVGLGHMVPEQRTQLEKMVPAEWIKFDH